MDNLEVLWKRRSGRPNELQLSLQQCFHSVKNPYEAALYLTEHSQDFRSGTATVEVQPQSLKLFNRLHLFIMYKPNY